MKDFFKYVLATVVGLFVFGIIAGILGVMSIVGMISSSQATKNVSDNSVLVLNLSGVMEEQSNDNPFLQFTGGDLNSGLQETMSAIKKAKDNDNIKGIYIEAGAFSADFASLQELRNSLSDFRKSRKWIIAYGDIYTQSTYYLASVATKVYMNPEGSIDWHGLGSQPMFYKNLLAKFGVKMQIAKVGKYKSATEPFTEDKMSDASKEQLQVYIDGLWQNICKGVSESRNISVEQLNQYADNLVGMGEQKNLIKCKMIDGLLYSDEIKKEVKKALKLGDKDDINQLTVLDMQNIKETQKGEQIAVYYAYGTIVQSSMEGMIMSQGHTIVGKDVCKDLESLMNDDDVKAVVIRVNSPGGSAYASEQIWHQIELLKKKKPVVVSMGGLAASGGYYMSCNSNWIVAEPTTITGSIGIFGMIPDFSQLLTQKFGVQFDEVKTNKNALMGTMARPMNTEELGYIQAMIDRGYNLFRKRVADGRHMTIEQVEQIAQGHVFLGQDAIKLKLIDEFGGLDVAVNKAAKLAKLNEYNTQSYPAPLSIFEQMRKVTNSGTYLDKNMRATLGEYYEPFMLLKDMNHIDMIQARLPFFINTK